MQSKIYYAEKDKIEIIEIDDFIRYYADDYNLLVVKDNKKVIFRAVQGYENFDEKENKTYKFGVPIN